jgi:chromosome partitioning protein
MLPLLRPVAPRNGEDRGSRREGLTLAADRRMAATDSSPSPFLTVDAACDLLFSYLHENNRGCLGQGWCGKTTLAAHLAVEAAGSWIIDTDKQGTLSQWHERRQAETPERLEVAFSQIQKGLETLTVKGVPYCVIDTAAVIALADFVLVPVRPSPDDLWAVGATVDMVRRAGKPFLFALCQAKSQAMITAQAAAALSDHGRVARSFITDRVAYAAAMTSGNTAPEALGDRPYRRSAACGWT